MLALYCYVQLILIIKLHFASKQKSVKKIRKKIKLNNFLYVFFCCSCSHWNCFNSNFMSVVWTGGDTGSFGGVERGLRLILCGIDAHHRATQIAKRHGVERLLHGMG